MKLAIGIAVFFILLTVRPVHSEPNKTFTDDEIMKIKNLLQAQKDDLDSEKETSAHWYSKYLKLQACIKAQSLMAKPVMACLDGNKQM